MRDDFTMSVEDAARVSRSGLGPESGRPSRSELQVDQAEIDAAQRAACEANARQVPCAAGKHSGVVHPDGYVQCRRCYAWSPGPNGERPPF